MTTFLPIVKTFFGIPKTTNPVFCPMPFDGQGAYWLSDSSKIRNPYFGEKRLSYLSASRGIYIEQPVAFPFMPVILILRKIEYLSE